VFSDRIALLVRMRTRDPEAARDLTQEVLLAVMLALRNWHLREGERLAAFSSTRDLNEARSADWSAMRIDIISLQRTSHIARTRIVRTGSEFSAGTGMRA
jgi:hypothetical protein